MENELNQRIGDYEILGVLGAGGMGKVYRVRNVISDRVEAMKILLPSLSDHREVGERFLREIKLVASLHHPNIANLCTAQTLENHLIMVMEFVDGDTFSDLLDQKAVPLKDALNYFDQALAALGYAHAKGIVHRDIKPSNIMLTPEGVVKLMDFGIARNEADRALTQTGATIGTVSYMSPEQIAGKPTDGRSDLYSMGIFIYETVTGEQPFKGTSDYELMAAHMHQTPRAPTEFVPGIPEGLNQIILKLLSKSPDDRFQNAQAVREAIRGLAEYDATTRGLPRVAPMPAASSTQRATTTVEGLSTTPSRMPTTVESRSTGTLIKESYSDRRMTEVAPAYTQPAPAALVVRKKGFARNPALYIGGGLALTASAIAVPFTMMARNKDADRKVNMVDTPPPPVDHGPVAPVPHPVAPPVGPAGGGAAMTPPYGSGSTGPGLTGPGLTSAQAAALAQRNAATQGRAGLTITAGAGVATPPPLSPEKKAKLDEEELHIDQIGNRAQAINNSLNTMQRSLQKDGVSLRGDIAGKQSSMNTNLAKAKQALATLDPDRAGKFAAMADTDAGELETFLGR